MFTGIIEEIGQVQAVERTARSLKLTIKGSTIFTDIHIGDSIAVNGVCLTVTSFTNSSFQVDVMPESVDMTTLLDLKLGSKVNLERAMSANGRFGGHIVAGHVDGKGKITHIHKDDISIIFTITTTKEIMNYIIYKGSIAVDGASLTVSATTDTSFNISIIPHTIAHTILAEAKVGTIVNLETDITGRYIRHFMNLGTSEVSNLIGDSGHFNREEKKSSGVTSELLAKNGFI